MGTLSLLKAGKGTVGGGAAAPFGLDGSAHANVAAANTVNASLTTTRSNDVIICSVVTANTTNITVSGGGLTWSQRAGTPALGAAVQTHEWSAIAASPLSGATITVTDNTASNPFMTMDVFGISGANTASPFDGAVVTGGEGGTPLLISTTASDTFIIGLFSSSVNLNPTAGTGFTAISGADFALAEYDIVAAPQTNLSVAMGATDGTHSSIADAIKKA